MSVEAIIQKTISRWMEGGGQYGDVVISSRVRLARNLEGYPFPIALSESKAGEVIDKLREAVTQTPEMNSFEFINLSNISPLERHVLVEKHLISPQHAANPIGKGVVISEDQAASIMVNEEDHLRIQCLLPGLNLEEAWQYASRLDDQLESQLDVAFSENLGYLTACPTNVGTGLRASAMIHLPALAMTNQINRVLGLLPQLGLTVRGMYGEGSESKGNLFQVSNQVTLGQTEEDILANLAAVTKQVVDQEQEARQALVSQARDQLEDRVWRAYGILANARLMSGEEALALISDLRLGSDVGIIKYPHPEIFNELIVITGPAYLQYRVGREMSPTLRDKERATIIRSRLQI